MRVPDRPLMLLLALVALLGSIASGASLPHLHDAPGVWNEEHELTLFAASSPSALTDVVPAVIVTPGVTAPRAVVSVAPPPAPIRSASPRAPPSV